MHAMKSRERGEAFDHRVEVVNRQDGGKRERQQADARRGAHRRQIAEVDRERAVADRPGRREGAIEVDALDEGVDGQHLEAILLGFNDSGVVADADGHPGRRRRQPGGDARDEIALREIGNRGV
jgi:hypothetical protein